MRPTLQVSECTLEALVGQIHSWSAYAVFRKRHPDEPDPALAFKEKLRVLMERSGATHVMWTRETTLLLACGSKPLTSTA